MEAAKQESAFSGDLSADESSAQSHWKNLLVLGDEAIAEGRLEDAIEHCTNALGIAKANGPESFWLAESYVRLGDLCAALDQREAALHRYSQAIAILDELPDGVSALLAHAVGNMGRLCMLDGDLGRAMELTAAADALQRKLDQPDSPAVKLNLALVAATAGNESDAEQAFRDALAAAERSRDTIGALAFAVHDNFAEFAIRCGREADAEMALRSCLILRQEAAGPRHPIYADGLVNLARLHLLNDAEEEGETLLWQASEVYRTSGGAPGAALIEALYLLARTAREGGRADEVEEICNYLLTIGDPDTEVAAAAEAAALHIGALVRLEQADTSSAEAPMRRALNLAGRLSGDFRRLGGEISGALLQQLSEFLMTNGKGAEAERLTTRADELRGQPPWAVTGFVFVAP